jgi:hypothetical protein
MFLVFSALIALVSSVDQFAIDDENPSQEHFCVLDERTGEPVNCRVDDDDDQ